MELNVRFPIKTAAVVIAAALLSPLVADWAAPGAGCRAAFDVLWTSCGGETPPPQGLDFSLWSWIVRLVGWNVEALGVVSFAGAIVCAGLVGQIVGDIFAIAITRGRGYGIELEGRREFAWLRNAAVVIGTLAFVLTPAFLRAATQMGPLMVWMAQPLMVVAIGGWFMTQGRSEPIRVLRRWWWGVLLVLLVFVHSVREAYFIRHALVEAWTGFAVFAAVGVAPCLALAGLIRFRLLFIVYRRVQLVAFGAWALAVVVTGVVAFRSVGQGRAASRLVSEIIANAEGKRAIVCDGGLEPLFAFALGGTESSPRLISLAHEYDPAYGRRLAEWVREEVKVKGEGEQRRIDSFVRLHPSSSAEREAWEVFREITEKVDRENYTALLNRMGMLERGYKVPKEDAVGIRRWRTLSRLGLGSGVRMEARRSAQACRSSRRILLMRFFA